MKNLISLTVILLYQSLFSLAQNVDSVIARRRKHTLEEPWAYLRSCHVFWHQPIDDLAQADPSSVTYLIRRNCPHRLAVGQTRGGHLPSDHISCLTICLGNLVLVAC